MSRKPKRHVVPHAGKRAPGEPDPLDRGYAWSHQHPHCRECGTTIRPHLADGLCVVCWRAAKGLPARGAETIPVVDREGTHRGALSIALAYPTKEDDDYRRLMERSA
jgi:hypothetical protein